MDISTLSRAEKLKALAELEAAQKGLSSELEQLKETDPFWWYEPSDGRLTQEAEQFLSEYIKPEDTPQKFDSQLDIHKCEADTVLGGGGNQVGKSTVWPIEVFIHITGELPYSLRGEGVYPLSKLNLKGFKRVRVVGESAGQMKEVVVPRYRHWCPREYLKKGSWEESFNSEHKILTLYRNGRPIGTVQFMSNEQDTKHFQGATLTMVVYDEEPKWEIYKENLLRFATTRLRQGFGMTPTNGMSWVYTEIVAKQSSTTRCFKLASVTNRHINFASLREIIGKIPTYAERKMRVLGEWVSLSGLVYGGLFNRDVHVIPPFPVGKRVKDSRGEETVKNRAFVILRGLDPHMVKPTACVELAVDRMGYCYVVGCYYPHTAVDIEQVKADLAERARERCYRLGWAQCDKSADSNIHAFKDLNVYQLLRTGPNAIRGIDKSAKFTGSIAAGVDTIKQYLKVDVGTGKPRLFIMDTPENQLLIQSMETMERDTFLNEEKKGQKDKIAEGKHDLHAAMRYIFQRRISWIAPDEYEATKKDEEDETYI